MTLKKLALRQNVSVGDKFHVGPWSTIWAPQDLKIGSNVYVGKHVTIEVDGVIGDEVLIANNVGLVGRNDHKIDTVGVSARSSSWVGDDISRSKPMYIGSDVWVGFGAVLLSGIAVGSSAIIGAGALVTKDVPENAIVAGVPARVIGERYSEEDFKEHWRRLATLGVRRFP